MVYEITKEELPLKHNFKAVAVPPGEYRFDWYFGYGFAQETKGKEESSVSNSYNEFKQYKPKVTLYDMKGNVLSSYDITLTLKEKEIKPTPTPSPTPTSTPTPVKEEPAEPAGTGSVSGTIEMPKEGIKLNYTVSGGNITEATDDGWESKFFIKGTVRSGEIICISVSGNGTNFSTWHHVNQDREATMSIWFNVGKGEEGRQNLTIAPGDSGSLTGSFTVPEGARRVEVVGYVGNTWINPYGGGSRSLILNAKYEVKAP